YGLGAKRFRGQQPSEKTTARADISSDDKQTDHVDRDPVDMDVEWREQNKDQAHERDRSAEQIIGMAVRARESADDDDDFRSGALPGGGVFQNPPPPSRQRVGASLINSGATKKCISPAPRAVAASAHGVCFFF